MTTISYVCLHLPKKKSPDHTVHDERVLDPGKYLSQTATHSQSAANAQTATHSQSIANAQTATHRTKRQKEVRIRLWSRRRRERSAHRVEKGPPHRCPPHKNPCGDWMINCNLKSFQWKISFCAKHCIVVLCCVVLCCIVLYSIV